MGDVPNRIAHKSSMCEMKRMLFNIMYYLYDDLWCTKEEAIKEATMLLEFMDDYEGVNIGD